MLSPVLLLRLYFLFIPYKGGQLGVVSGCSCTRIHLHASTVSAAPLMVAVFANYRPWQTIITTHTHSHTHREHSLDIWTHLLPTLWQPSTPQVHIHTHSRTSTLLCTHTHWNAVFRWGFLIHFVKKSTLTPKLVYGLPTILLLYVFPLEAITAQTAALAPTFSCGFITFDRRAGLIMSSMHCVHQ